MGQTGLGAVLTSPERYSIFLRPFLQEKLSKILIQGDYGPSHQTRTLGTHRTTHDTPNHNWYFGGALGALAALKESKVASIGCE